VLSFRHTRQGSCTQANETDDEARIVSLPARDYGSSWPAYSPHLGNLFVRCWPQAMSPATNHKTAEPMSPTSPRTERTRRSRKRELRKLTVIPPVRSEHIALAYTPHMVLDGGDLRGRDSFRPRGTEPGFVDRMVSSSSTRTLVRSLSTPPMSVTRGVEVVRLFAAEMP